MHHLIREKVPTTAMLSNNTTTTGATSPDNNIDTIAAQPTITILAIPSFNPTLDAAYLRELLLSTTTDKSLFPLLSDASILIENDPVDVDVDDDVSLWISSWNTLIVFIHKPTERESFPQSTGNRRSDVVVWTVPTVVVQKLRRQREQPLPPLVQLTLETKHSHQSSDSSIGSGGNGSGNSSGYYVVQLPSRCSSILLIPNSISVLQTTTARRTILQQLRSVSLSSTSTVNNPTIVLDQQQQQQQQQQDMVDIPLLAVNDTTTKTTGTPTPRETIITNDNDDNKTSLESSLPQQPLPTTKFVSLESKILTIDKNPPPQSSSSSSSTPLNESYQPLVLNSQYPIPFETNLFRGQILIVLRPTVATEDPYWYERIFHSKKRKCIITVQGQFKSMPRGIVYAGAEISQPMKLGLVIKGICTILLKLVERFNSNIHSSFGTSSTTTTNGTGDNQQQEEAAHIVAPAYTFYERLVVTKPHESPPSIMNEIEESPESIQLRKGSTSLTSQPDIWNTTDTFTFSFYSMYIDLPTWQLVGLPASGDIGLKTFWGSSLLRICMYDKTDAKAQPPPKQHLLAKNRYAFSIQLDYLGKNGERKQKQQQQLTMESPKSTWYKSEDSMASPKSSRYMSNDCNSIIDEDSGRDSNNKKNDIFFTDRRLRQNLLLQQNYQGIGRSESQLFLHESSSCDESMEDNDDEDDLPFFDAKEDSMDISIDQTTSVSIDNKLVHQLSIVDQHCPYWIELCTPSRNGGSVQYVTAFACCIKSKSTIATTFRLESDCDHVLDGTIVNNDNSSSTMTIREAMDPTMDRFSSRISSLEKMRRYIGLALSDEYGSIMTAVAKSDGMIAFRAVNSIMSAYDADFLSSNKIKPPIPTNVRLSGYVARAYSDRHWVEEWVCLYDGHIACRHLERRKSSEFVIVLTNIIRVEKLIPGECPFNNAYPILAVSTLASTVYFMFTSDSVLENWSQMIDPVLLQQQTKKNTKTLDSFGAAADDFLQKSSTWNCKNRRILNCGAYYFRIDDTLIKSLHPLMMAENALRLATALATNGVDRCAEDQLYAFMKSAAYLKHAFASGLDEASRLAFNLNIYHTIISHAYLVLGPPDSSLKWINYFNNIAYQVGDDIFSLTELEHSIIRANMSYPTQFLSRFVIPKSAYPNLALTISDCRINFALNCGSMSNPSKIIVYQPHRLNQQLDDASRLYLLNRATYRRTGSGDLELKLPRICQWFADDFGGTRPDMLSAIEPYLPPDVQRQLDGCRMGTKVVGQPPKQQRFDMSSIIIRYHSYNFECRPLSIM